MDRAIVQAFATMTAVGAASLSPATAAPITYKYVQTSSSVPDFIVTGTMVIDGALGAGPGINNQFDLGPYNFDPLLSLDVSLAGFGISLSWFTAPDSFGFPFWIMGGGNFLYRDPNLYFNLGNGPIFADTDNPSTSCRNTGVCTGEGHWEAVPVPEPTTLALFGSALVGLIAMGGCRKRS